MSRTGVFGEYRAISVSFHSPLFHISAPKRNEIFAFHTIRCDSGRVFHDLADTDGDVPPEADTCQCIFRSKIDYIF